jgi:hypothetical protein
MPKNEQDNHAVPAGYVQLKGSERRSKPTTKFIGEASGDEVLRSRSCCVGVRMAARSSV